MGNVQKTSRWLGVKLGITVVHKNGMIESYEESSGTSVEAWVDKGETVEGVSNQLLGKLQDLVDAERTRIKSEMRVLASFHAGPTIPRIHEEMLDRPDAHAGLVADHSTEGEIFDVANFCRYFRNNSATFTD